VRAAESALAALEVTRDGARLATASEKGTLVRWVAVDGWQWLGGRCGVAGKRAKRRSFWCWFERVAVAVAGVAVV
jgi:hypothetical protein